MRPPTFASRRNRTTRFPPAYFMAAGLALLLFVLGIATAKSQAVPAPSVTLHDTLCYRSILEADDLFCVGRFELPQQSTTTPTTAEAWCAYLIDNTGCTGENVAPDDPTSLEPDLVFLRLYTDRGGASETIEAEAPIPRIWHGLAGIYLGAGYSFSWGASTVSMCVETDNASEFSTQSEDCLTPFWTGVANVQATQRIQLGEDMLAFMRKLEIARSVAANSYVLKRRITTAGAVFAREVYSFMGTIIPDYFQAASVQTVTTPFVPNTTPHALQTRLDATATAVQWSNRLANAGAGIFGLSGGAFATYLFMGAVGIGLTVILFPVVGNFPVALTLGMGGGVFTGVFVRGPTIDVIAVSLVMLAIPAGWFWLRRAPN